MMVKATPTSTFVMAQAEFTFELFVITFDAPAQFGIIDECGEGRVLGKVESQYFVGAASPFGHSTSSHSTGCGVVRCSPARRGARERRRSGKQAARSIPPAR